MAHLFIFALSSSLQCDDLKSRPHCYANSVEEQLISTKLSLGTFTHNVTHLILRITVQIRSQALSRSILVSFLRYVSSFMKLFSLWVTRNLHLMTIWSTRFFSFHSNLISFVFLCSFSLTTFRSGTRYRLVAPPSLEFSLQEPSCKGYSLMITSLAR